MTVLAGPFAIATAVLALGGVLKMMEPADTAHALTGLGLPGGRAFVRIGGAIEAVVAIGALVTGNAVLAATPTPTSPTTKSQARLRSRFAPIAATTTRTTTATAHHAAPPSAAGNRPTRSPQYP